MAPRAQDTQLSEFRQDDFQAFVRDTMRDFVRIALTTILEEEVTALIGAAPYEHNARRRDRRNGSYTRDLDTSVGRIEDLPVPRTRDLDKPPVRDPALARALDLLKGLAVVRQARVQAQ